MSSAKSPAISFTSMFFVSESSSLNAPAKFTENTNPTTASERSVFILDNMLQLMKCSKLCLFLTYCGENILIRVLSNLNIFDINFQYDTSLFAFLLSADKMQSNFGTVLNMVLSQTSIFSILIFNMTQVSLLTSCPLTKCKTILPTRDYPLYPARKIFP